VGEKEEWKGAAGKETVRRRIERECEKGSMGPRHTEGSKDRETHTNTLGVCNACTQTKEKGREDCEICTLTHIHTPQWGGEKHTQHMPAKN